MKTTKKILASLFSLPLLISATSALAHEAPNKEHWVATSNIEARVLANNLEHSHGLVVNCFPGKNKIVVNVHDLDGYKGQLVRYWTENNEGSFITRKSGIVSSAGNDIDVTRKFISDIAHDYSITFQAGNKKATYSLVDSADTLRSLQGCGLPQARGDRAK